MSSAGWVCGKETMREDSKISIVSREVGKITTGKEGQALTPIEVVRMEGEEDWRMNGGSCHCCSDAPFLSTGS